MKLGVQGVYIQEETGKKCKGDYDQIISYEILKDFFLNPQ